MTCCKKKMSYADNNTLKQFSIIIDKLRKYD